MKLVRAGLLGVLALSSLVACQASRPSAVAPKLQILPSVVNPTSRSVVAAQTSAASTPVAVVAPTGTPTWISIPLISVSESIKPGVLNGQGELEPPKGQVIWYQQASQRAGNSMLIAGHDEWDGPSDFWNLDEVKGGDSIIITYSSGQKVTFTVSNGKSELKTLAQTDRSIWAPQAGAPEIVVVTCDKNTAVVSGHHVNNYIVYAMD